VPNFLAIDKHADLFADQLERAIGDAAVVSVLADRLAVVIENCPMLHGALCVLHKLFEHPGAVNLNTSRNAFLQFGDAGLNVAICCQARRVMTAWRISRVLVSLALRFALR
jgi:hypothetical protein